RLLARTEHAVLEALELGSDEALRRLHGLAPDVVLRHAFGIAPRDFDEEALHPVVTELESREPGAFSLAPFELQQEILGVRADVAQLIELDVIARGNHLAIAHHCGRLDGDRGAKQGEHLDMLADARAQLLQERRIEPRERVTQGREGPQRGAQLREIAGTRRAQRDARQDALDIAHSAEMLAHHTKTPSINERAERVITLTQQGLVAQRAVEPAAQLPRAHRGDAAVDDGEQRRIGVAGEARVDLEIAAARGIERERIAALL